MRIDPETGLQAYPGQRDAIFELFKQEDVPAAADVNDNSPGSFEEDNDEDSPGLLF